MKNKNLELALKGSILKGLLLIAIPTLLGNFLQSAYQFVDAYRVGKVGKEAVAAVSVSWSIVFLIIALGTGFAMAGTILVAHYAGAKNQAMVNRSAGQTLVCVVAISIVLSLVGFFASEWILSVMGVAPEVMHFAVPYLQTTFCGLTFMFVFSMVQSILRGVGEVNAPLYIIAVTAGMNLIIDPILILGWAPFPPMGPQGAAVSTLILQAISSVIGMWLLCNGKYGIKLSFKDFKPDFEFLKKAFKLGLPASLEMSARALGFVVLVSLVASFGTIALSAYGAGQNINQLIFIPLMALSISTSTMVGQNLWAQQPERAHAIARVSAIVAFISLSIFWALIYRFAPWLISIFIEENADNAQVIKIGSDFLKIMAFSLGFIWIQFSLMGVFRAAGNTVLAMVLGIIWMFGLTIPLSYTLSKRTALGVNGIWRASPITNILMAGIVWWWYHKGDWKSKTPSETAIAQEEVFEEVIVETGK